MKLFVDKKDIVLTPVKGGIHAGGQHAQKNATGIRAVHLPSGITVVIRGRSRQESIRKALLELNIRVRQGIHDKHAAVRKARRDVAIHDRTIIRSYHFPRGEVRDHRTGKRAPLKEVLEKGRLDLLGT